jgi:hypothetical protein
MTRLSPNEYKYRLRIVENGITAISRIMLDCDLNEVFGCSGFLLRLWEGRNEREEPKDGFDP